MPNKLIHETSPYLLQHAHNPVDWHAWNTATLQKARSEEKLMIVSIGYAACHWCHVMEHESFSDEAVADIMNENFIPVKVDREERPDVDDVYMTACQITRGTGGWPLNAITLPDGRPLWVGTYFPKVQWINILQHIAKIYREEPMKAIAAARKISEGIRHEDLHIPEHELTYSLSDHKEITARLMRQVDTVHGGLQGTPKFVLPHVWQYLLIQSEITQETAIADAVHHSLRMMSLGGLYDLVDGGFARYSVDERWLVPHFEKMLYDNAQMLSLYAMAYKNRPLPYYARIMRETIHYISSFLTSERGIYAAMDADSEGEEGTYYIWDYSTLDQLISAYDHSEYLRAYYAISPEGNWEGNIILRARNSADQHKDYGISEEDATCIREHFITDLKSLRTERTLPNIDTKIITSWNALYIIGLFDAANALNDTSLIDHAIELLHTVSDYAQVASLDILRINNQTTKIGGMLDDYAFLILAYIRAYETVLDPRYIQTAKNLLDRALEEFVDAEKEDLFFYSPKSHKELVVRRKEVEDNVIPSSNAALARCCYLIGHIFDTPRYLSLYQKSMSILHEKTTSVGHPQYFTYWAITALYDYQQGIHCVVMGENAVEYIQEIQRNQLLPIVYAGNQESEILPIEAYRYGEDTTNIYICKGHTCLPPEVEVSKALKQLIQ